MQKKLNNKGFTIVEVLIVLAIAGAILAAVLIAVPALQRSGRNATAKTAAQQIVSGIQESEAANGGAAPAGIASLSNGLITWTGGASGTPVTTTTQVSTNISAVTFASGAPGAATVGKIYVSKGYTCNPSNTASQAGSANQFAVMYPIEGGAANPVEGCIAA